ncbi:MAG TPA: DUF4397 domain-containing protein [Gemmatimonadaceae bacterium]|jgi:hypothetical protein
MRVARILITLLAVGAVAGCDVAATTLTGTTGGQPAVRVVNAFTSPVDVLVDGSVAISALAAGQVVSTNTTAGNHSVVLRPTGASTTTSQTITAATGAMSTIAAAVAVGGALTSAVLDDTNNVVPSGATKLRVIHLAPNAGTLQVYRTQPDFSTPVSWQSPFNYQSDPTSATFVQSTVGSWEVRVWQSPADASGWDTAPARIIVPLVSGEKATIVILDKTGGGVRLQLL